MQPLDDAVKNITSRRSLFHTTRTAARFNGSHVVRRPGKVHSRGHMIVAVLAVLAIQQLST